MSFLRIFDKFSREGLEFIAGDAQKIPFDDGVLDAVYNVESSHCYPNVLKFFEECYRILKPGGHMLFTDFRRVENLETLNAEFKQVGFTVDKVTDITQNVIKSMKLDEERKKQFIKDACRSKREEKLCEDFAGFDLYNCFNKGTHAYVNYTLRKA